MLERAIANAVSTAISAANGTITAGKRVSRAIRRPSLPRRNSAPMRTFTRYSVPSTLTLVAGEAAGTFDFSLNQILTSDLIGMFDQYRLNWVEIELIPRFDPAQSGVTNNTDVWVTSACDPTGQITGTPSFQVVSSFENSKVAALVAGKSFRYRMSPKATNALAAGNFAVNQSDWLILSSTGTAVSHLRWLYNIRTPLTTSTQSYDFVIKYNFSVKQAS